MGAARWILLVIGVLLTLGGAAILTSGGYLVGVGLWTAIGGIVIIAAVILERSRYRSAHAEHSSAPPGPGGGEPLDEPMDQRFRRTDELFVDPTTGHTMRVWLDPSTGERRYRAEG
jgi:hypothetical protein